MAANTNAATLNYSYKKNGRDFGWHHASVMVLILALISILIVIVRHMAVDSIAGFYVTPLDAISISLTIVLSIILFAWVWSFGTKGKLVWMTVSLLPSMCIVTLQQLTDMNMWASYPQERFKDHLCDPIPASVSHLRFVPYSRIPAEHGGVLSFDIRSGDLDKIIRSNHFKLKQRGSLENPHDTFNDPKYLSMGVGDQLYQANSNSFTYTLLVDHSHTTAVFRFDLSQR